VGVKACLNGGRTREEHPAVPLTAAELAAEAKAARAAGAFAVHFHPRDRDGRQTLAASFCDAAVAAVRSAAPRIPVGLSTAEAIDPDPFARAAALSRWRTRPDFVSVNLSETGWAGIVRAALQADIAVEAGLATPADAEQLAASPFGHRVLRALVEVEGGADEARAVSALVPTHIPQLWHGYGPRTWEVIRAGLAAGVDVRVGLEDVLELPDGQVAEGNAQLVASAIALAGS
jgi:uncharacterized protein (DUF849 family)